MMKIDQNRTSKQIGFRTVKFAEILHTMLSRYLKHFACFKCVGMDTPLLTNQKVTKYLSTLDIFSQYGHFCSISTKIGGF